MNRFFIAIFTALQVFAASVSSAQEDNQPISRAEAWRKEWPGTDFSLSAVPLREVESIIRKDGIPSINDPRFIHVDEVHIEGPKSEALTKRSKSKRYSRRLSEETLFLSERDPVISVEINGEARAYPLRIMMYHEIVNDEIGGSPIVVTYCPLCNTGIVFDRVLNGAPVEFGVSGKLRKSSLIMYDRRTQSWWQQYTGRAIVGKMTGHKLKRRVTRLESFLSFKRRYPDGLVLTPNDPFDAPYGRNPYLNYDSERRPFLYRGSTPEGIKPLARVVVVGDTAYSLARLSEAGKIVDGDIRISWRSGQASAVDAKRISEGRDVGNVVVQRKDVHGVWRDIGYDVIFAFVFHAFHPKLEIVTK